MEVVPCFEGTLVEELFAGILLVGLVQMAMPLDLAPVEELVNDVPTAAVVLAAPLLNLVVQAGEQLIEELV